MDMVNIQFQAWVSRKHGMVVAHRFIEQCHGGSRLHHVVILKQTFNKEVTRPELFFYFIYFVLFNVLDAFDWVCAKMKC